MTINKNKWIYCIICRFILSRWAGGATQFNGQLKIDNG